MSEAPPALRHGGSHFLVNHRFASPATSVTPCGVTREGHSRTPTFPPPPNRLARAAPPPGPLCLLLSTPSLSMSLSPPLSQITRFLHRCRLLGARTHSPSSSLSLSLSCSWSRSLLGLGALITTGRRLFVGRRSPPRPPRFRSSLPFASRGLPPSPPLPPRLPTVHRPRCLRHLLLPAC